LKGLPVVCLSDSSLPNGLSRFGVEWPCGSSTKYSHKTAIKTCDRRLINSRESLSHSLHVPGGTGTSHKNDKLNICIQYCMHSHHVSLSDSSLPNGLSRFGVEWPCGSSTRSTYSHKSAIKTCDQGLINSRELLRHSLHKNDKLNICIQYCMHSHHVN
jgi:hypothetical protein